MKTQHTPTNMERIEEALVRENIEYPLIKHISKCVNSHDALVEALKEARLHIQDPAWRNPSHHKPIIEVINQALAKAGE